MNNIIFFQPMFKEKIWGGSRLEKVFGMSIPSAETGECWLVSAHTEGETVVRSGAYEGWTLRELWDKKRELFGNMDGQEFPLLIKFIDANEDLSVQVHPDENSPLINNRDIRSKTECWYILDCEENTEIIYGHNASTREELREKIAAGKWDQLLSSIPVKKNDFVYVPGGTVHALKKGMLVLEIQQSSDTTFRLYDYGRLENGKPRTLHIEEAVQVINIPHTPWVPAYELLKENGAEKKVLARTPFFTVTMYTIDSRTTLQQDKPFLIVGVIEGEGSIDGVSIKRGDHFMLPYGYGSFELAGDMTIITSAL
ncbi:MAG TPA: mannose-6-phosphate isomerase, class I [Clostridia bacterium]|nr:mannose-6-phosphate isomerase, class I [Clostridia bacterium]